MSLRKTNISLILFFFLNSVVIVLSGQGRVDSLLRVVKPMTADTNTALALSQLCLEYGSLNIDSALFYGNQGLEIALRQGYLKGQAQCLFSLGKVYNTMGDFGKAETSLTRALKINTAMANKKGMADCLINIGVTYKEKGDYSKALKFFQRALSIYEFIDEKKGQAKCYNNIGIIFHNQKNYALAMDYYDKSLTICTEMGYADIGTLTLINIGNIKFTQADYQAALKCFQNAYKLSNGTNITADISSLHNIGNVYTFQNQLKLAVEYYKRSLEISKSINSKKWIAHTSYCISNAYSRDNQFSEAIQYAKQSLSIALEIGALENILNAYNMLAICYSNTNDYKTAYENRLLYDQVKDSINEINSAKTINELETKYKYEENKKKIALLKQEKLNQELIIRQEKQQKRNQIIIFGAALFCVLFSSVLVYLRYRHKQRIAASAALAEQQRIRFKEVIEAQEQERKRIAEDLHDSVGLMMATTKLYLNELEDAVIFNDPEDKIILENSVKLIDETHKEVRNISHNMMPGALIEFGLIPAIRELITRINKANQVIIELQLQNMEGRLDESVEITVYRIIQEILNNTIKHANALRAEICLERRNSIITLTIQSDGNPIDKKKIEHSSGIGWKNIFSRVTILNGKIVIDEGLKDGSIIRITIPDKAKA